MPEFIEIKAHLMTTDRSDNSSASTAPATVRNPTGFWPQLRRFLIFQIKLYVDAVRDLILSALSLGAFLLDLAQGKSGPDCHFERVLKLGRQTEQAINLFNQHDPDLQGARSVDGFIRDVEDRLRNESKK